MNADDFIVWRNIAIIPVIVCVVQFLFIALCREWVKTDLRQKICAPIQVRWQPFTWWPVWGPAFRVVYEDAGGNVHAARCGVPAWKKPVIWREDEIVDAA
jgi:hypothetical protein